MKNFALVLIILFSIKIYSEDTDYNKKCNKKCRQYFTSVYKHKSWGEKPLSGQGSDIEICFPYVNYLKNFLKKNNKKTVLDLGCGDFNYAKQIDWNGIQYIGIDTVDNIIKENIKKYKTENIKFICGDILETEYPNVDLIICKHVLLHIIVDLKLEKYAEQIILKLLNYKYCLLTDSEPISKKEIALIKKINSNLKHPFNIEIKHVCEFYYPSIKIPTILITNLDK